MNNFEFNKSDYQLIIAYFGISIFWLVFRYNVENYTNFEIVTGLLGFVIKTTLLIFIITLLIKRYMVDTKNYTVFFLLTFCALGLIGFLDLLRDYFTADPPWQWNSRLDIIIVNSFYNSTPDVALPLGLILGKKYYEYKLNFVQLQNTQKDLELKVLRSQYDPHFLYNSLNTIDALIDYSPKEKVKEYIAHLASLYRYLIHIKDEDVVILEDEIALAKNYFYLIKTRFEKDYSFEIVDLGHPSLKYLPSGALLTVLENIVKHNKPPDGGTIETIIYVEQKSIRVVNSKSGQSINAESLGIGLLNLEKRYRLLSNTTLDIKETKENYTIKLPMLSIVD